MQLPGVGAVVEHRIGDIAAGQDGDVGDAGGPQGGFDTSTDGSRADDDDVSAGLGRTGCGGCGCHRKLVRFQARRAIGPIRPISVKNAASGAKPTWCISRRCALARAIFRARCGSRPTRA